MLVMIKNNRFLKFIFIPEDERPPSSCGACKCYIHVSTLLLQDDQTVYRQYGFSTNPLTCIAETTIFIVQRVPDGPEMRSNASL